MTAAEVAPLPLIVDASVAVKWVLHEPDSDQARALLTASVDGRLDLVAPAHLLAEATNALWARAHLRREISVLSAQRAVALVLSANVAYRAIDSLIPQALDLALAYGRTIYDCLYVALALRDGSDLVTADRVLAATFGPSTGRVVLLSEFDPA